MVPNKSRKRKSKSATAISTSANANPSNGEGLHYSLTVLLDAATRIESLEGKTSDEQPEDENAVVDVCSDVMPPAAAAAVVPSASAPVKEPAPKRRKRKPKKPKDEVAQSPSASMYIIVWCNKFLPLFFLFHLAGIGKCIPILLISL